jgi:hypothetical protein
MLRELNLEEQGVKSRGDWVRYLGFLMRPYGLLFLYNMYIKTRERQ